MAQRKAGQGSERRQRSTLAAIRLTFEEKAVITACADQAGLSFAAYVRCRVLGKPGPRSARRLPVDAVELRRLAGQLGYVGNNLNQLTRLANIGDLDRPEELADVLERCNAAIDSCLKVLGREP